MLSFISIAKNAMMSGQVSTCSYPLTSTTVVISTTHWIPLTPSATPTPIYKTSVTTQLLSSAVVLTQ